MKTKFKKLQNDKNVKILDKKAKTKVSGKGGTYRTAFSGNGD